MKNKLSLSRNIFIVAMIMLSCLAIFNNTAWPSEMVTQKNPDVLRATVSQRGLDTFDFDVTVSSPYDTPQRYADAFSVTDKDGKIYGERILVHDHAGEQPFTRDLYHVSIPAAVKQVVIQARDMKFGYGGKSFEICLPGR